MNTKHECCARRSLRRRVARNAIASLGPGVLLALAPKCPLCVAAYLTASGLGAGAAAGAAPWLRPAAVGLLVLLAVVTLRGPFLAWVRAALKGSTRAT